MPTGRIADAPGNPSQGGIIQPDDNSDELPYFSGPGDLQVHDPVGYDVHDLASGGQFADNVTKLAGSPAPHVASAEREMAAVMAHTSTEDDELAVPLPPSPKPALRKKAAKKASKSPVKKKVAKASAPAAKAKKSVKEAAAKKIVKPAAVKKAAAKSIAKKKQVTKKVAKKAAPKKVSAKSKKAPAKKKGKLPGKR